MQRLQFVVVTADHTLQAFGGSESLMAMLSADGCLALLGVAGLFVLMAALRRWVSAAAAFWTTVATGERFFDRYGVAVRDRTEIAALHGTHGHLEAVTLKKGERLPLSFLFLFLGYMGVPVAFALIASGLPLVATNDLHYTHPGDADAHLAKLDAFCDRYLDGAPRDPLAVETVLHADDDRVAAHQAGGGRHRVRIALPGHVAVRARPGRV